MYILVPIIFFALILLFPIKIKLSLHIKLKDNEIKFIPQGGFENKFNIYLFGMIPVYKKTLFNKPKANKNTKKSNKDVYVWLYENLSFEQLSLSIGFNSYSQILNSYINAVLNSLICIYVNTNQEKFNLNKLYYQVYVSDNPVIIDLDIVTKVVIMKLIISKIKKAIQNSKILNKFINICEY